MDVNDHRIEKQTLFEIPVQFELSKSSEGSQRRMVKGYGTTGDEDLSEESLLLKGLDYTPLKERGFINYDHQKASIAGAKVPIIIGYPTLVEMRKSGLWIEGELFNGDPMASEQNRLANEMWEFGQQLQKSGAPRQLAYSIEGGILERKNGKLLRTVATSVALTHKPVNPKCSVELFAKSFWNDDLIVPLSEAIPLAHESLEKAATIGGSAPLMKENLDRGVSSILYGEEDCDCGCYDKATGRFHKSLAGAYRHLTDCRGMGRDDANRLLSLIVKGSAKDANIAALAQTAGILSRQQ